MAPNCPHRARRRFVGQDGFAQNPRGRRILHLDQRLEQMLLFKRLLLVACFLQQRPQDAFGRHRYDPSDFGWTYPGLADEFAGYIERYSVAAEHR